MYCCQLVQAANLAVASLHYKVQCPKPKISSQCSKNSSLSAGADALAAIQDSGVIACLRARSAEFAFESASAALDGGVTVLELVLSNPGAFEVLDKLVRFYPTKTLGVGTVLDVEDAKTAIKCGAKFLLSPAMIKDILDNASFNETLYVPGAMTPTEILSTFNAGARLIKGINLGASSPLHSGTYDKSGEGLGGLGSEAAAQKLRGCAGTTVTVKIHPVNLPREIIQLTPISSAIIPHRTPDGRVLKTGYVKLSAFSQTAAMDMEDAIFEMENQGVQSYILDLRNNPGGLVKAGLDVAQIWLDGDETLVNTVDRDGNLLPINMIDGHALTHDPLVVLVNEESASASEILAGALHDNGRAILVGHKTFGKGKIKSVTELHDGSALFVTVAKYLSPALHDIDQVGITPDVQCSADLLSALRDSSKPRDKNLTSPLEADSCIMMAEHELDIQNPKIRHLNFHKHSIGSACIDRELGTVHLK